MECSVCGAPIEHTETTETESVVEHFVDEHDLGET